MIVKAVAFAIIMVVASVIDIKRHIVQNWVVLSLFCIGLIGVNLNSFLGLFASFVAVFIPAIITKGIGGGDVKIVAMCGFVLGVHSSFGLICGIMVALIFSILKGTKGDQTVALVPFLTAGYFVDILKEFYR